MQTRYWLAVLSVAGLLAAPVFSQPEAQSRIPIYVNPGNGGGFIVELNPNFDDPACKRCLLLTRNGSYNKAKVFRLSKGKTDEVHVEPARPSGMPPLAARTKSVPVENRLAYLVGDSIIVAMGPNSALNNNKHAHFLGAIMNEDWLRAIPVNKKALTIKSVDFLLR